MRLPSCSCLAVVLLLAGCGDDPGSGPTGARASAPRGFQGTFRGEGPNGSITFTLVRNGDVVEISSAGDKAIGRVVSENRVEATTKEGDLTGHVVLTLEGDGLRMQSKIVGPDGETVDAPELVLQRVGTEPTPSRGAAGAGARDARLVAHWRSTEARASGGLSYATDTHLILNEDGTFETWDKTTSSVSGTEESAHTTGAWKTEGGALWIKPDGRTEWSSAGKYGLTDTHMMLTDARGEKTIYERL